MRWLFQILFYLSLVFIGLYLYRFDYLMVPVIRHWGLFSASLLLCFAGFIISALNWRQALRLVGHEVPLRLAIVSSGLSIFTKYIPGKVLVIVGRAAYVVQEAGIPMRAASAASLLAQLLMLWLGFLLGSVVLFDADIPEVWTVASASVFALLTVALLCQRQLMAVITRIGSFFNKDLSLPLVPLRQMPRVFLSFTTGWLLWSVGFHLLVLSSVAGAAPSLMLLFAFPLAAVLAIAALFAPGGLGVREGVLVACMVLYGMPADEATGLAILSRLWFLAGEVFIFVLALILREKSNNAQSA